MATTDEPPPSFHFPSMNSRGVTAPVVCQSVEEMEVLGALIQRNGTTGPSVDHRLAKANAATHVHHKILFGHGVPERKRFAEYAKRIVPMVLHACGSWAWDSNLWHRLHSWEGKLLARMMNSQPPPEDEQTLRCWVTRYCCSTQIQKYGL